MTSVVKHLVKRGLIKPPGFVDGNIQYETEVGSVAYGTSIDASDLDIYGFCIPPQHILFPHLVGIIPGFDRHVQSFDQYQQHHIVDPEAHAGKGQEYDISVYNIVKYFRLCLDGNPNMVDSLFTAQDCVRFQTPLAVMVREGRRLFLSMNLVSKFRGYSLSQIKKMQNKSPASKRYWMIEKYGLDLKFAAHAKRLLLELDWTKEEVIDWVDSKALHLEKVRDSNNVLPSKPREHEVKELLLNCLEHHYGSLGDALILPDRYKSALTDIQDVINVALG